MRVADRVAQVKKRVLSLLAIASTEYLLNYTSSSYAWMALGKVVEFCRVGMEQAVDHLFSGINQKATLDRAVAYFIAKHILTCSVTGSLEKGDFRFLVPFEMGKRLCQGLLLAITKKMKLLYGNLLHPYNLERTHAGIYIH